MNNTYYILCDKPLTIQRLHICTWEIPWGNSYIEFGFEIEENCMPDNEEINIFLALPYIKKADKCIAESLHDNLKDTDNCKFIFNATVKDIQPINGDSRNGNIIHFNERDNITILPISKFLQSEGYIKLLVDKPKGSEKNCYFRILIPICEETVAIVKKGISRNSYIYDIKVNEKRNIPQNVFSLQKENKLHIAVIKRTFCFHSFPENFDMSFVDSSKLKNVRKLETDAFQKYLPQITDIKKDCYDIIFLKEEGKDSYSFFTTLNAETIGSKQITLAIGANILCSLLFAEASLRVANISDTPWYKQIPIEYGIAVFMLVILVLYMLGWYKNSQLKGWLITFIVFLLEVIYFIAYW